MTTAAVAGTFDVLHDGHKALLRRAFEVGDVVMVGITSDRMASGSRGVSVPMHIRRAELEAFLSDMGEHRIFEIDDIYGPDEVMDSVDVLVVSEETMDNGRRVNERRVSRGLKPMELSVVPLVMSDDGGKISSSAILMGEYGRSGHRQVMDIAVGSANQVKVSAVRSVMERVSRNRALAALGDHDMAVGIEAGVFEMLDGLYDIQHCTIVSRDGRETYGHGSGFRYPDAIAALVRGGMTVGDAVHEVYGDTDIGKKQGAVGLLSKGLIDRKTLTEQSVTAAMIPRIWDE